MYCGSCLRDNALATELMRQGHDVTLLPLYTPTLTDEANVSEDKVLFGGISVYLEQHSSLFRHTPRWMDKLWDSQTALKQAAKSTLAVDAKDLGELTVSMLRGEDGHQRKEFAKLADWLKQQSEHVAPYDVIDMQNSLLNGIAATIKQTLRAPLCCTMQGEDLFINQLHEPYRTEALRLMRANAKHIDCFIAVSRYYADYMAAFLEVPRDKIKVVPLGLNLKDYARFHPPTEWPRADAPFTIGYFGRIAPEKGLHLLAEAFIALHQRAGFAGARLAAAGYLPPDQKTYLQDIETKLAAAGLREQFHYHGSLEREAKLSFFSQIDLLSLPTTYAEPKGLPVLEAQAAGLPVVQPRWGSFPEMIERTNGGVLFEPNDAESLAEAIYELWQNPERGRDLARQGFAGVREHYTAEKMADAALSVYSLLNMVDSPMPRSEFQYDLT